MSTLFRSTICLCLLIFSAISLNAQGSWSQKQDYYGGACTGAVSFVIGDYAYVGLGYSGSAKKDFYKYNPQTNAWTPIANFGGLARQNAVAFVVNDTAYVGLGDSGSPNYTKYKDFWKYDVTLNTWKKMADFGGTARTGAMAFVIGTKAYVGTGQDDTDALKDLWEYTPAKNTWAKKNDITADKRKDAVGFSINGKGYLCSGIYTSPYTNILSDIQEYNPTTDTWTEKVFADGSLNKKQWADCFILNNKAYLISGNNTNSVVVYDPATNTLSSETAFGPSGETGRSNVIAFALNSRGYAGLGIVDNTTYKSDFWQFSVPLPPQGPVNLIAEAIDNSKVKLTWNDKSNDETNFVVERSDNNNSAFVPIDTLYANYSSTATFINYNLQDTSKYYYRVRAKNNLGYSAYSNEVAVTTFTLHTPKAPGNLIIGPSGGDYVLSWKDNSTNENYFMVERSETDNQHYSVKDSLKGNNILEYPSNINYYRSLPDSSGLFFRIRAKNNAGYSAYSNEVYIMTKAKAPVNFRAIPKSINEVDLYWSDQSSVETGFVIERSANDNLHYQKIDTLPVTQNKYNDRDVENGTTYYYRIAAIIRGKLVYSANEEAAVPLEMGTWLKLTDFPTYSGKYGVNLYYDSIVYSGFGYDEKQFYGYSLKTKKWEKKANLGDNPWSNPVSMVINNKGFVCLGSFNKTEKKKAWEYDFANDKWTQKNDVPFADRDGVIVFSLENKGYILGGRDVSTYNKLFKDFYQYDITTDTWVQLADFPGGECSNMPVFVYNKKAYLLLNGTDLWEYSPISNVWLKIRTLTKKIPGNIGANLNEHFYIFFNNSGSDINPMYEYNFIKDEILKKASCPGNNFSMAVIKDSTSLYAMAGYSSSNFWNYCPSMPSAPINLTAKALAYTKIELNWSDETDLETNYIIERAERVNYSYDYKIIDTLEVNSKFYLDTTVTKEKYYRYRLSAKGKNGFSEYSYSKVCKTGKPTGAYLNNLTTEYNKGRVKLYPELSYYDDFSLGYIIERSTDNANYSVIDTTNSYNVIDSLLTVGKTYYYRVRAYNNFGNSDYSQVYSIIAGSIFHSSQALQIKEGYYLDGGGLGNYSSYNSVLTLKPFNSGEKIAVDFKKFKLAYHDSLFIYDGTDTKSPILAKFHNEMQVYGLCASSSNSSGALTFELKSRYNYGEGWVAYVKSTALPPATILLAKKSTGIVLTWKDNSDLETNFVIERSASDTSHFAILASPAANAVTYTDTTASPMQKYYYRIKAVYSSGSSEFSNIAVSDGTILDVPQILKNSDIILFPNPASSNCTLRMNLAKEQSLSVSLANVTGTILNTKAIKMPSGPNEIPLDVDDLPAGTYFVIVKSDIDCVTKILTISR
jgi:N-acetylneuraminic acid mutarotase